MVLMDTENEDKVYYCAGCLSLAVVQFQDQEYCRDCGSDDIRVAGIEEWEKLYKDKYHKCFINHKEK